MLEFLIYFMSILIIGIEIIILTTDMIENKITTRRIVIGVFTIVVMIVTICTVFNYGRSL